MTVYGGIGIFKVAGVNRFGTVHFESGGNGFDSACEGGDVVVLFHEYLKSFVRARGGAYQ